MRSRQRGAGGLFIAVLLLAVIGGIAATLAYLKYRGQGERGKQEQQRFEGAKTALQQFVSLNKRLPCPTDPAADTGVETANVAAGTCTFPTGTIPWSTLGLRRDDAIDNWGSKISYRVYTGTSGSLTQTDGMNMYNCDTVEAAGWNAGRTTVTGSAGGLCRGTRNTLDTEFLAGKGLAITSYGTAVTDAAYVLVSHGPSGLGGFTAVAPYTQKALPASASELANLAAAGPFVATNHSMAGVGPSDAAHFDDFLAYERIGNLVRLAGLTSRDWDDTGQADVTTTAAAVESATGSTPAPGTDLGVTAINFETARVTGLATSGTTTQNLTFDNVGGVDGLGTASGATGISSASSEGFRIELKNKSNQLAITLNHFGNTSFFGTWREQVRFDFYNGASLVSSVTKQGCRADGGLASFTMDLGATQYDKVDIMPIASTVHPVFGTTIATSFFVSAFKGCATGVTCQTSLYLVGNSCP